jgi:hypothetical protein
MTAIYLLSLLVLQTELVQLRARFNQSRLVAVHKGASLVCANVEILIAQPKTAPMPTA